MTTYYVGSGGSDGAAGTSYALRWATIGKALGAAGIASGDTVYLTPGTFRETVTVAMTSATVTTNVIGDVDGSHTSGVPGEIVWTGYTTNDTTAPAAARPLTVNGRDFLAFSNITFVGGNAFPACVDGSTATSTDISFTDCTMQIGFGSQVGLLSVANAAGVALNWTLSRCRLVTNAQNASGGAVNVTLARHTVDYDANVVIKDTVIIGSLTFAVRITSSGAGVGFAGGVKLANCTLFGGLGGITTADANLATTIPSTVNNSIIICTGTALLATTSGQITEDWNVLNAGTPRTNVTAGTNSKANVYAPRMHFGQELLYGGIQRPFLTPTTSSPLLGFGDNGSASSVDLLNRRRPSGGASTSKAVGALERHDFGTKETGTVDTGGLAVRLTGPGDHQFIIPVTSGVARTVALKVYYDTNHATTNPPQAQLVANNAVGYAGQTVTAAATTGSFVTLTFTQFTPTATGYVIMRLISRSAAASGFAIYDTVTIT